MVGKGTEVPAFEMCSQPSCHNTKNYLMHRKVTRFYLEMAFSDSFLQVRRVHREVHLTPDSFGPTNAYPNRNTLLWLETDISMQTCLDSTNKNSNYPQWSLRKGNGSACFCSWAQGCRHSPLGGWHYSFLPEPAGRIKGKCGIWFPSLGLASSRKTGHVFSLSKSCV